MDRRAWTLLLILAAIWGASYLFIEIGLRDMGPAVIACLRVAFGALVLVPIAASRGELGALRGGIGIVVAVAAVQAAGPFLLIGLGQEEISSSLAGILVSSTPLFTALLAIWLDHEERSTGLRLVGVLVGFGGVVLLLGVDLGHSGAALLGGSAVLVASFGYALGGFVTKRKLTTTPPLGLAAGVMVASTILLLPAAIVEAPAEAPGAGPLAAVAILGLLGTGIAFALFFELIGRVGPARAFVVTYVASGFALVYGVTLLDEPLTAAAVLGLGLIVAGSWLAADGRLRTRQGAEPPVAAPAPRGSAPRPVRDAARLGS
jgi:drug/metabolite transporter (DMT)-like permease